LLLVLIQVFSIQ